MQIQKPFHLLAVCAAILAGSSNSAWAAEAPVLRAGAFAMDIAPPILPVIVNGGFLQHEADSIRSPLHARCLVLDDGQSRLAIAVVDNCLIPRELLDDAKQQAHRATGIPIDRMLISATHTHSAPSVCGALGSDVDEAYARYLPGRIAQGIARAVQNLAPAEIGWTVVNDFEHTHCRRWILRPDRIKPDPFGFTTVRAMMHPGYQNPDYIGPAGPVDPALSILSIRSAQGRPIALLANYSMHYFGAQPVSADYYGLFAEKLAALIAPQAGDPPFVAIMSQGTSGDLHWMDYAEPKRDVRIEQYASELAQLAYQAYQRIEHRPGIALAMKEKTLTLPRRTPSPERLAWARDVLAKMKNPLPSNQPEVYAREQIMLAEEPTRELKLQAVRIGDLGITAIPCEVFGITGLKIKAQSPLQPTFNLELANGADGYIPPPEQHTLGGYNTWPARTAGLEVEAEPKIVEAVLNLLSEVSGRPRRELRLSNGPYAQAVLASRPLAYWRMEEFNGPQADDATGHGRHAMYQGGVAFYLEGPASDSFSGPERINRAAHFAGGCLEADLRTGSQSPGQVLGDSYAIEMWFWNGLPADAREITGTLFARLLTDPAHDDRPSAGTPGECLSLGGKKAAPGKLIFQYGQGLSQTLTGAATLEPKSWHHVVLTRDGRAVKLYLDGKLDLTGEAPPRLSGATPRLLIGSQGRANSTFEGRIDEVAVYNRPLPEAEIDRHSRAAQPTDAP